MKNSFRVEGDKIFVALSQGLETVVDAVSFEKMQEHPGTWGVSYNARRRHFYVASRISGKRVLLHRFLLNAPRGIHVDHEDGDGLNNSSTNLRLATRAENARNRAAHRGNSSGFKGVCERKGTWLASISIGSFPSAEEAACAYDRAAKFLFGEFARLNFPEEK